MTRKELIRRKTEQLTNQYIEYKLIAHSWMASSTNIR